MMIDMTRELAPLLIGLNAALIVSGLGVVAASLGTVWMRDVRRSTLTLHRPALAGAR
ncbi:MAG: hypothetical protein ACRD3J_27840 [Thermoanaerobaculia bacterium]